jgi:hypothetical protein
MSRLSWRWWQRDKNKSSIDAEPSSQRFESGDRRHLLQALSAMVGGGALAAMSRPTEAKDASELPPPKRVLTGRDEAGKSVFKSVERLQAAARRDFRERLEGIVGEGPRHG